jgi:hypothetical protein
MSEQKMPKTTTPREPLIVHVPTALSLVLDQVRIERKRANDSDAPPPSEDVKQAVG